MRVAVTGAFGYSGRYITRRLLEAGHEVITLTNSLHRANPFGAKVAAHPFNFEEPRKLRDSLRGVQALVNTYWVRFDHRLFKLQPIYVDDLAQSAAQMVAGFGDEVLEAIGPETFTYRELVAKVRSALGVKRPIISAPPELGYWGCRPVGLFGGDVVITREEIRGLIEGRLYVDAPPLGATRLTEWIDRHKDTLGRHYTSEMARRIDRVSQYRSN